MTWAIGKPILSDYLNIVVDAAWKGIQKRKKFEWRATVGWQGEKNTKSHIRGSLRVCATSALQAECLAIWEGLKIAAGLSRNVLIKTDYQEAIQALSNPKSSSPNYVVCVKVSRSVITPTHISLIKK